MKIKIFNREICVCALLATNSSCAKSSAEMRKNMKEKVVLAYSGGLDTTAIIPWLKENYDYEVICVCIDCGQAEELDGLEERAKFCGAEKLYILDVTDEFCDEYIVPCVQANAVYENKYLLEIGRASCRERV